MVLCPAQTNIAASFHRAVYDGQCPYGAPTSVLALENFDKKSLLDILALFCNSECHRYCHPETERVSHFVS